MWLIKASPNAQHTTHNTLLPVLVCGPIIGCNRPEFVSFSPSEFQKSVHTNPKQKGGARHGSIKTDPFNT